MTLTTDVIVIGLGAAGAAVACRLAKRGARVIALDRHQPPHDHGSSHGESRITRQAIGEGDIYVPLALRAHRLWRELEVETGATLMESVGALVIGGIDDGAAHTGKRDFVRNTIAAARRFDIPHELLTPAETMRRHQALTLRGDETVYFEPGGGLLHAERCVAAQIDIATRHGAAIRAGETALAVESEGAGVRVVTDRAVYSAGQVVVAAGPWTATLLGGDWAGRLSTFRQVMHWFPADDPTLFSPERFPVFIWMHGAAPEDWFYGFPHLPGSAGVKIADEKFDALLAGPNDQTQLIEAGAAESIWRRHIRGRIAGISGRPGRSAACLYAMAPDSRFLIGRQPGRERVIVVSACSGHGFKHSSAIGDLVAELAADGRTPSDLAPFALDLV